MIALLFLRSDDDNEKIFKISYLIIFRNKWSVTFNEFQFLAWRSVTNVIVCLFDKNCNLRMYKNQTTENSEMPFGFTVKCSSVALLAFIQAA